MLIQTRPLLELLLDTSAARADDLDELVSGLAEAHLLDVGTDSVGCETWTLTSAGTQVARQMAMSRADDAAALVDGLLHAATSSPL
jgi:hypothetical protein